MNTASVTRKQTSFRLSENLLERLRIEAKKQNRSLNNLVESVLLAFVSEKPNKTTLAAMKEAETSDNLETLDLSNFCNFVDSL
ncbi:MAG: toxin-antitoxin system HicB family antitoxin [Muribaculaceae bacterium]|nr:toxin-antitoxin system HicB family antitoxin [Muribaculaceae bacterium]